MGAYKQVKFIRVYCGAPIRAQMERIRHENIVISKLFKPAQRLMVFIQSGECTYNQLDSESIIINLKSPLAVVNSLSTLIRQTSVRVLYAHNVKSFFFVFMARLVARRPIRIVTEFHGASAFEIFYKKKSHYIVKSMIMYVFESCAGLLSNSLVLVSNRLKRYYPAYRCRKSLSVPRVSETFFQGDRLLCPADESLSEFHRFVSRARLAEQKILVYSGGYQAWQMIDETLALMDGLAATGMFVSVVFSQHIAEMESAVSKLQHKNAIFVAKLDSHILPEALSYCDIGILLREPVILNLVASPTKLYEYLNAGLYLVTTCGVPEAMDIIRKEKVGVILDLKKDLLSQAIMELPKLISKGVQLENRQNQYTWQAHQQKYIELFI